jgi:hypothetical protein
MRSQGYTRDEEPGMRSQGYARDEEPGLHKG